MTFTHFPWWKNSREERLVSLRLRGREVRGAADLLVMTRTVLDDASEP